MWAYLTRRLIQAVAVVFVMAVIVFFGVNVIGNPVDILINPEFTEAEYQEAIKALGLDLPLHEQFIVFLSNAMEGDLGISFVWGEPALQLIAQRLPATLELAGAALLLSIVLGVPLGMYAGTKPHSWVSKSIVFQFDPGVFAADILGRHHDDYGICRDAGHSAIHRTGRNGGGDGD